MSESVAAPGEPGLPILILSCYRTGSTLLRYIMDTHPEIYSPPEVFLGQAAFDLAHFSAGLAGQRFDPVNPGALPGETIGWLRSLLARQLEAAAALRGKRLWCEKTPSNLVPAHLALLRQVFPEARMLCLHRHCLDMVQSLLKMMNGLPELQSFRAAAAGHAVTAAISYWCERTTTLLEIEDAEPSLCVRLRYEDMVSDPARALEPVFRFLDLAWDRSLLDAVFETRHDRGMQDHYIAFTQSIHTGNIGAGGAVSLSGVPEKTLETMDALSQRLAYPDRPAPVASERSERPTRTGTEDVRWFFETHLPERVRNEPDLCASFGTLYQFVVAGGNGGAWVLDPRRGLVSPGRSSAVCNVEVSANDLFAIARGGLHPVKAAEQGRLRLRGDIRMQELEKLVRLLQLTSAN
jgi:protein-tyrosine sulfotransferase